MFYFLKDLDIANYVDDCIPCYVDKNFEFLVNNLEQLSSIVFKWFNNNYMKEDTGKSLHLVSRNVRAMAKIANNYTESENEQVLLVIQLIFI